MNLLEVKLENAEYAGMLQDAKSSYLHFSMNLNFPDFCLLKRMFVTFWPFCYPLLRKAFIL